MDKHIFKSRTFWFNVAAALLPLLADNVELVRDYLPDGGYLVYMCLVSAGNVYLRTVTTTPVRLKR
ncbi:hypothetical protein NP603_13790 [Methylomonas sp. SURF-1]|uniref:Uncharacterized protein n=1 Tax=Methylomonas aurea TaxID=2952224 RepID=A0ABT1UIW9_9GAMM|nr:hypothetical protein [Methylomonas sp. SURF-1]MCQ8182189.1 hypothetical protein [Methylomonas sp. SURF-1]